MIILHVHVFHAVVNVRSVRRPAIRRHSEGVGKIVRIALTVIVGVSVPIRSNANPTKSVLYLPTVHVNVNRDVQMRVKNGMELHV